jgi:hypothetical protein
VLRWIVGLALALWPQVNQWLVTSVKMKKASVDEKWITIRQQGLYWFVVLDAETGLPLYRIFNDPFAYLRELSGGDAENLKNVKEIRGMAKFLTTEEAAA